MYGEFKYTTKSRWESKERKKQEGWSIDNLEGIYGG